MIKYILDTHVVLWLAYNSPMLSAKSKQIILDKSVKKYVSIISAWEVAIKLGTKKLDLIGGLPEFFKIINENGFILISVKKKHLGNLTGLPDFHRDPFDRLLISTAMAEKFTIVTVDENIQKYDVPWTW